MRIRIVCTLAMVVVWGWVTNFLAVVDPLVAGKAAGMQLENSDTSYVASQYLVHAATGLAGWVSLGFLLGIVALWWKPAKGFLTGMAMVLVVTGAMLLATSDTSHAYYDKQDWPEIVFIAPNESFFFIPDVGANKDSQVKFGSKEYYDQNKIAAKRYQIPHTQLPKSSWTSDYYVPAGRGILVDRTPYYRQWVADKGRGTSARDEGVHCQSKEGLNITVGVSMAASVTEENAPTFLYSFGIKPIEGDRMKPEVAFVSVFHGYSLTEVMDGVARARVETLICSEFTTRTFEEGNASAAAILTSIETKVREYLASVGITLGFVGWSDTFTFDPTVQDAINRAYIAGKDKEIATALEPHVATLQDLAAANALRSFGEKTDGKLPRTIVNMPGDVGGLMGLLMSGHKTGQPKQ